MGNIKNFSYDGNQVDIDEENDSIRVSHQSGSKIDVFPDGSSQIEHVSGATIFTSATGEVGLKMPEVRKIGLLNIMNIVNFQKTVDSDGPVSRSILIMAHFWMLLMPTTWN